MWEYEALTGYGEIFGGPESQIHVSRLAPYAFRFHVSEAYISSKRSTHSPQSGLEKGIQNYS